MSFKGQIEAECPRGCEPFEAEVWSFIRGDKSPELRLLVIARECNMLLCPACQTAFFPEATYIYFEPRAEILAFVFPESYRAKAETWRRKMRDDFKAMKESLGAELSLDQEPEIFFGHEDLGALLEREDYREEEREVMEYFAKDLGLSLYRVSPKFARENGIPSVLPYAAKKGSAASRESVIAGLQKLVAANDRLTAYAAYLKKLGQSADGLPPRSSAKPS